ncbi:MAG: tetratricopeptide repeat protein [Roseobacter sp.]
MKQVFGAIALAVLLAFGGQTVTAQDLGKGRVAYKVGKYETALAEFRPLAEQGDAKAQHWLGLMYFEGKGVPQNFDKALKWYRLAAEQGDRAAQNSLGVLYVGYTDGDVTVYSDGRKGTSDHFRAHMWFNIAASFGSGHSMRNIKSVEDQMTAEDISTARQMALECVAKDYKGC